MLVLLDIVCIMNDFPTLISAYFAIIFIYVAQIMVIKNGITKKLFGNFSCLKFNAQFSLSNDHIQLRMYIHNTTSYVHT